MPLQYMFDNRKSQACTTRFARTVSVGAVEPLGQARQMRWIYPDAFVGYG